MIQISQSPSRTVSKNGVTIDCYDDLGKNLDTTTVNSFGEEWEAFHHFDEQELLQIGNDYFDIVTLSMKGKDKIAADFGCGSGRWTKYIAGQFGAVAAIDLSDAIFTAATLLADKPNVKLYKASIDNLPFSDNYFDFGFSLGVLHHIPDTAKALSDCVKKVKPGGHFLVYLYYSLDNRGLPFKALFHASNLLRYVVSKLPSKLKRFVCDCLAVLLYMPFVLLCRSLKALGVSERVRRRIPLQYYENTSFYIIRNDSLDRLGTPLEQRFSRNEIQLMMEKAGLTNIVFSENAPYWHCVGQKL